jgi:hypothetical protein
MAGQQACIGCIQTDCQGGAQDFFKYLQNCLCNGGPCTSQCSGANDYCVYLGCNPSTGCSNSCNTCLNTYTAAGKTCDGSSGTVAACCNADSKCSQYITGAGTNCP